MQRGRFPWQGIVVCAVWACGMSLLQGAVTPQANQATQDETTAKTKKHKKSADATSSQTALPSETSEKTAKARKAKPAAQDTTSAPQATVPAETGEKIPKAKRAKVSPPDVTSPNSANRAMPSEAKTAATAKNASSADIQAAKASGQVWVNTSSGVYHKGGRWYGATKEGKFMSEQDAIKAGYKEAKNEK
jgi:type IV secretory pathway VirB10-like protein